MTAVPADKVAHDVVTELPLPRSPGERLRDARKARGVSITKIAAQLHLKEHMVELLEEDRFDQLPGRVFVQGYLRNYARLVGLPAQSILEAFTAVCPDHGSRELNTTDSASHIHREMNTGHGLVRTATWGIVAGLVGLLITWWWGSLEWPVAEVAATSDPAVAENANVNDVDPVFPEVPEGVLLGLPADEQEAAVSVGAARQELSAEAPRASATPPADPAPDAQDSVVAGTVAEAAVRTPPLAAQAQPVIEFSGDSWVDIRDASRRFKLFGVLTKGTVRSLDGEPPYKIVIGNVEAVRLLVNGEPYDLEPHSRGNVARFTLDPVR